MKEQQGNDALIQKVLEVVSKKYGTTPEAIRNAGGKDNPGRRAATYLLKREFNQPIKAVEQALGMKGTYDLYNDLFRATEWLKKDKEFRTTLIALKGEVLGKSDGVILQSPVAALEGAGKRAPVAAHRHKRAVPIQEQKKSVAERGKKETASQNSADVRSLAIYLLREHAKFSLEELCKAFNISDNEVYTAIGKVVTTKDTDHALKERIERVCASAPA